MADIIDTSTLDLSAYNSDETYWLYNGFDNCITYEVYNELMAQADATALNIYNLSLNLQAPILEMNLRGLRVNQRRKHSVIHTLREKITQLEAQLLEIVSEGIGITDLNWNSPPQLKRLFYEVLQLPVQKKRNSKGIFAPTVDEGALEKLSNYFLAEPICNHILTMRGIQKSLSFLATNIDSDGRMRTRFNIAGTNTGRFASSATEYGTGTNLQNVTSSLRSVFVADPGMMLCNIDLEQADSRNMGALCWNRLLAKHGERFAGAYLDACESGDLHTTVTKMAYTNLPWGEEPDRALADLIAHRHLTYRDLSKKLGHGSNYLGTPPTMAKHARIPVPMAKQFQKDYFTAFACIPEVHKSIITEVKTTQCLTTPFGRRRVFWSRPEAAATHREAVAYMGQSMTADELNTGLLRLWRTGKVQLLVQVHDSILFQFPEHLRDEIVPMALECLSTKMTLERGREFTVGTEAMTGWNWGYVSEDNPDGLKKWKGGDERKRTETQFKLSIKDL